MVVWDLWGGSVELVGWQCGTCGWQCGTCGGGSVWLVGWQCGTFWVAVYDLNCRVAVYDLWVCSV